VASSPQGCRSLSDLDETPRRGCRQSCAAKRCSPLLEGTAGLSA